MRTLDWKRRLGAAVCGVAMMAAASSCAHKDVPVEKGAYTPDWESLSEWECPEWFKDAKFGLWAHWGPQCQAMGGDWYARHMYYEDNSQYRWHQEHFGDPGEYGFKEVIRDWKAERWQPDSLIALYKSVGARYFMTLGNHHDNFDLWDSPYQEWNSVNMGPQRDIVGEWAAACKKYGLPLGVSMHASHTWTWMEKSQDYDGNLTKADGKGQWWEGYDPQELYAQRHEPSKGWQRSGTIHSQWAWGEGASLPSEEYKMKFQNRVLQCINDYQPDMLYFDDTVLPFYGCDESVGLNILTHYYNRRAKKTGKTDVVVMGKILEESHKEAMLWDVERGAPDRMQEKYWQTCTCIGGWHYSETDYRRGSYKSAAQVVRMLVDIVSKNGNLLLSVPVRGDGSIDEKEIAILGDLKEWMDVNGFSIYGTRTWKTFGEGPVAEASNPMNAQGFNEGQTYSSKDIRFVQRNDTVFATIMRWPEERSVTIESFGMTSPHYSGKVKNVELLGYGALPFTNEVHGAVVTLPAENTNKIAPVLMVTFDTADVEAPLETLVAHYTAKVAQMARPIGENTGQYKADVVASFNAYLKECAQLAGADNAARAAKMKELNQKFVEFRHNAMHRAGHPEREGAQDVTEKYLVEKKDFARKVAGDTRFGAPKHWKVDNYGVPNGREGVKQGIDRHPGYDCLMLGVWSDRNNATVADMSNARIYRKVRLEAGKYYFGASFESHYNLGGDGFIFAAKGLCDTEDIATRAIASAPVSAAPTRGFYGINFTLPTAQEVVLGFQADLQHGAETKEMRAKEVVLLKY